MVFRKLLYCLLTTSFCCHTQSACSTLTPQGRTQVQIKRIGARSMLCGISIFVAIVLCTCLGWVWLGSVRDATTLGDFNSIRRRSIAGFIVQLLAELSLWQIGAVKPWMLIPILVTNFWGPFDAVLRYPVIHKFDDIFYMKQVCVGAGRVFLYGCGYNRLTQNGALFFLWFSVGLAILPCLWLTALPVFDTHSQHMKQDVIDEDILTRMWSMTSPRARKQAAGIEQLEGVDAEEGTTLGASCASTEGSTANAGPILSQDFAIFKAGCLKFGSQKAMQR
eukprot:1281878-Amphidinium_carterae.2